MTVLPEHPKWPALQDALSGMKAVVVAVSGGVDSMLLATLAHRVLPGRTLMAHALSPAVPGPCTTRVQNEAQAQGWRLSVVESGEFSDERYLQNPFDRCYFCKTHLYDLLNLTAHGLADDFGTRPVVVSGANTDDLGEHRPGLTAAREHGVRHPFVEAGVAKQDIRAMAGQLGLSFADIPASPCLASRIYTGTRVTPELMTAVSFAEESLKSRLGVAVLRCRVLGGAMLVEMLPEERHLAGRDQLARLHAELEARFKSIESVSLDPEGYRPGRAFKKDAS
ncbi:hypothetical protein [Fundidesulfovibrio terrae]|uniref:ATP-dependent sacrificial sulfur transferase LarE n=1 Tax=Fundidesulfovibrio terrae TaxID=2922866 RepID=UPI001FB02F2E|nr:hypothetical protein [Fundidesulfovibrio terrae]